MAIIFLIVFYGFRLAYLAEQRMDALLHKMMPAEIVQRLKEKPGETIANSYDEATILFADLKGFTPLSAVLGPARIVRLLDELFTAFDREAVAIGMIQIKTIGDAYMAVAGLPVPRHGSCRGDDPLCLCAARGGGAGRAPPRPRPQHAGRHRLGPGDGRASSVRPR